MKDVYEWLQHGVDAGYCTSSWCWTHSDPSDVSPQIGVTFDDGDDPCVHVVTLLDDRSHND